ncbi:hypothetical protein CCP3SC15_3570003 [Gammaproteobacteria bacterium]
MTDSEELIPLALEGRELLRHPGTLTEHLTADRRPAMLCAGVGRVHLVSRHTDGLLELHPRRQRYPHRPWRLR